MDKEFPSYKELFELTQRRLKRLKKIKEKKTGELKDTDAFLFLLIGNINLRLNTIFLLLENGITDGFFALQRTVFELQLAFDVYYRATDKEKFIQLYLNKKGFESAIKWDKLITKDEINLFTENDRNLVSNFKKNFEKSVKENSNKSVFKLWYELASDKTVKELSDDLYSNIEYFSNYDEPSNWVHPQRLEENLDPINFNQHISKEYFSILIGSLMWDIKYLTEDISALAKKFNLAKSPSLFKYGEKLGDFSERLRQLGVHNQHL